MSFENDITIVRHLVEADVFQPANPDELRQRLMGMITHAKEIGWEVVPIYRVVDDIQSNDREITLESYLYYDPVKELYYNDGDEENPISLEDAAEATRDRTDEYVQYWTPKELERFKKDLERLLRETNSLLQSIPNLK